MLKTQVYFKLAAIRSFSCCSTGTVKFSEMKSSLCINPLLFLLDIQTFTNIILK